MNRRVLPKFELFVDMHRIEYYKRMYNNIARNISCL